MQLSERLTHPVGLPTLLPPGHVRIRLLAARREMGFPLHVPGDCNVLPEHISNKPFVTPERFLVLGTVAWDEIRGELTFQIVPGFFSTSKDGRPMIVKLSRELFVNLTSSTLIVFKPDRSEAELHQGGKVTGAQAGTLYRMLEELTLKDKRKWGKLFPPDPAIRDDNNKELCPECRGNGTIGPMESMCLMCDGSGMRIQEN